MRSAENIRQLQNKKGIYFEKWKTSMENWLARLVEENPKKDGKAASEEK